MSTDILNSKLQRFVSFTIADNNFLFTLRQFSIHPYITFSGYLRGPKACSRLLLYKTKPLFTYDDKS